MKHTFALLIPACFLLTSCNSTTPIAAAEPITVQYTAAAAPWLAELYNCAGADVVSTEQRAVDFLDPQSVDLAIRIGQPDNLTSPAYQIDIEELLVIVNPQNPVNVLTAEQVRGLFTGHVLNWQEVNGSNAPVQVWAFSSGEDVQQIFEHTALGGSPVTSTARLAASPDEMAQALASDVNAVGILTRRWKAGNVSDAYTVATLPVLALTKAEPQGAVQELLACLQK
ncbi:MAG: substrate-binding domain-containing protein [Chloroflexi bacterium]|nr:substrate-binding domain-containing protein [Chloroflexota bacterium]